VAAGPALAPCVIAWYWGGVSERPTIVAIDGPAGAGKSTVAKALAERLGFTLVDTGAIYRAVALSASRAGVATDDDTGLVAVVDALDLAFHMEDGVNHVLLDGEDVTSEIRTPDISMGASTVSARPGVRAGLLDLQRRLALETDAGGAVLEGRDIGTVVFPDADHKFFLTASAEVRAQRRYDELRARGSKTTLEEVLADQARRDHQDSTREVAPLKPADDAVVVDSTELGIEEVVEKMAERVHGAG